MLRTTLLRRCPRCGGGRVLRGYARVVRTCPSCGTELSTDPGGFLTAMAIAYGIAVGMGVPFAFWLAGQVSGELALIAGAAAFTVAILLIIYPLAKAWSIWLHERIGEFDASARED
ncbi:MAG: DUF983 domain-containing protein [Candidatus Dadabacteria bacterium]|nr:MAG: DUF983 domain-containing protein [Candidatus Dadabacteria bacterium]